MVQNVGICSSGVTAIAAVGAISLHTVHQHLCQHTNKTLQQVLTRDKRRLQGFQDWEAHA